MRKLCAILATIALVVLCVVMLPAKTQAKELVDSGTCGTNLTWTLNDEGTLTISGKGNMLDYDGSNVAPWQTSVSSIKQVEILDGVSSIGKSAFSGCSSLTSITIPDTVTSINRNAFYNCCSLTSITIPDTITSIGSDAFYHCCSLTSISIPDSVISIGSSAFSNCRGLTSITIPDSVTIIEYATFWYCTSLESVNLPDSIKLIDSSPFQGCNLRYNIYGNAKYLGQGNNPYFALVETTSDTITNCQIHPDTKIICGSSFSYCKKLTSITIPDGVTSIGSSAFSDCSNLKSITIPNSVTIISDFVFTNCSSLSNVSLSNGLASIGKEVFRGCKNLTSITIPEGVTSIGDAMFSYCSNLTHITIPDSVISIGSSAFSDCDSLTTITIPDSVTSIGSSAFSGINLVYNIYGNTKYLGNETNPYIVLVKATESNITECHIHPDTKIILSDAFSYCYNLSQVHISDLTSWCKIRFEESIEFGNFAVIEHHGNPLDYAQTLFLNGELVTDLVIPDGVTQISDNAFINCTSLTSITIPSSVTAIGSRAFKGCTNLAKVVYCGANEMLNNIEIGSDQVALTDAEWKNHSAPSDIEYTIIKEPTFTAMGEKARTCIICKQLISEAIPAKFYGTSVNLGNTLDMYFGFYTGLVDEGGKVKFVREFADGTTETTEAPITSFKKNNSVYDITYTGLAAKEMCDTIHIYVYNGSGVLVGEHSDSIRSYILRQLREKDYGQEFRTLCIDLLNYGAAAQIAFDYKVDDLANKDLSAQELSEGTQKVASYTDKQIISGITGAYYGTAYVLETKISMAMAVRVDVLNNGCYALVSYTDHTGKMKTNIRIEGVRNYSVYEFTLDEIVVADGRCLLTIEFYKADGTKVLTVQDSMESYTARNAEYYPLAEKMLAFSDSAYHYLH